MVCRRTLLLTSQRWKPVVLAFVSCWSSAKSEAALEFTLWALEGTAAQVEDERASEPKASSRLTGNWMGLTAAVVRSGLSALNSLFGSHFSYIVCSVKRIAPQSSIPRLAARKVQ